MITGAGQHPGRSPSLFVRLRACVLALPPWRAGLLAFLLGALGVLAHPPFHLWPVMAVSLTGLVWLLDGARARERPMRAASFLAWAFGFGYFGAGLWWVAHAFIARGPEFYALIPFAVTLLPAGLALFWAGAGAVCGRYWPQGPRRIALFAAVFFAAEYLRGHVLSGFPWQLPGMVWEAGGPVSQAAAWIGIYGLSLVTLFAFAAPAALAGPDSRADGGRADAAPWRRGAPLAAGFVVLAVLFAAGLGRLAGADPGLADLRLRVVQAAVPQDEKWRAENRDAIGDIYLDLTASPDLEHVDLVVWPEAALPLFLLEDGAMLARLGEVLGARAALAAGLYRRADDTDGEDYRNSLAVLDFSGGVPRIAGLYDKARLAPFGEFLPGAPLLERLGVRIPNVVAGFTPGPGAAVVRTALAPPFAPMICYETIFPRFIPRGPDRPEWMLNVSNDSWFGDTAGPRQHFAMARFRAIEEGLPMVRAASGGMSGAVDAYGRVRALLPPDAPGVLDLSLPRAGPPTFYSRYGDLASLLLGVALILVAAGGRAIWPRTALTKPKS